MVIFPAHSEILHAGPARSNITIMNSMIAAVNSLTHIPDAKHAASHARTHILSQVRRAGRPGAKEVESGVGQMLKSFQRASLFSCFHLNCGLIISHTCRVL